MYLTPKMQKILVEMLSNNRTITTKEQTIYNSKKYFWREMDQLATKTPYVYKNVRKDRTYEYRLTVDGEFLATQLKDVLRDKKPDTGIWAFIKYLMGKNA